MAENGFSVNSTRHDNSKLAGCTVMKFYSLVQSEAETAYDREVAVSKGEHDIYLIHCDDIMSYSTMGGKILRKTQASR